jgi:hypothetical protein
MYRPASRWRAGVSAPNCSPPASSNRPWTTPPWSSVSCSATRCVTPGRWRPARSVSHGTGMAMPSRSRSAMAAPPASRAAGARLCRHSGDAGSASSSRSPTAGAYARRTAKPPSGRCCGSPAQRLKPVASPQVPRGRTLQDTPPQTCSTAAARVVACSGAAVPPSAAPEPPMPRPACPRSVGESQGHGSGTSQKAASCRIPSKNNSSARPGSGAASSSICAQRRVSSTKPGSA